METIVDTTPPTHHTPPGGPPTRARARATPLRNSAKNKKGSSKPGPASKVDEQAGPAGFAQGVLKLNLYPWQKEVMNNLAPIYSRVALVAANGSGKTSNVIAPALVWHMVCFEESLSVVTASVYRQVESVLWPAIKALLRPFGDMVEVTSGEIRFKHASGRISRILGFTAGNDNESAGRAEGFHAANHESAPLMYIVDEAKTVQDPIYVSVFRCQPTRLLVASSPGAPVGQFYRCFTKEADLWKKTKATAWDCPHISPLYIQEIQQRYGVNSPFTQSMLKAEFMDLGEERLVVSLGSYDNCINNPPMPNGIDKAAGVDFSAGGDENAIAIREGNRVLPLITWRERDTMATVGRIIMELKKAGIKPEQVFADAGGLGLPMCDALNEAGWNVNRVNFGGNARDNDAYQNKGSEMWHRLARKIDTCDIILPDDDILKSQLVTRRAQATSRGKLGLESKDAMRSRGVASPDRADAVAMACDNCGIDYNLTMAYTRPSLLELMKQASADNEMSGWDVGG